MTLHGEAGNPAPSLDGESPASRDVTYDKRIPVYILLFGVGALLVAGWVGLHLHRQYHVTIAQWAARQNSVADDRTRMVADWLQERRNDAQAQARRARVIDVLRRREGARTSVRALARSLDSTARIYGYSGIFILNPQGQVVARSARARELDAASRVAARVSAQKGEPRIVLTGKVPKDFNLSFSTPVFAEIPSRHPGRLHPRLLGALVLRIPLADSLFPLLLSESVPTRSGETLIACKQGDKIVFINPLRHIPTEAAGFYRPYGGSELPMRLALDGEEKFGTFLDYRGVRVLAATRRIPATGWGLVRKIDRAEALEGYRSTVRSEALAAVLMLAAFGGLLFAQHRYAESTSIKNEREKLRALLESAPDAMVIIDHTDRMRFVNSAVEAMFGYTRHELLGQSYSMLVPERFRAGQSRVYTGLFSGPSPLVEHKLQERWGLRKDGEEFPAEITIAAIATSEGRLVTVSVRDISERRHAEQERRRLNRALRTLSECNQAMIRAQNETELLENVCRILVREGGYGLAWVGYAEQDDAKTIRPVAQAGAGGEFLATAKLSWAEGEGNHEASAQAIRSGEVCITRTSPKDGQGSESVSSLRCGLPACVTLPLISNGRTFGALNLCSSVAEAFDAEEKKLLTELAADLAHGVRALRIRSEQRLAEEMIRLQAERHAGLISTTSDGYWRFNREGRLLDVNDTYCQMSGYTRQELLRMQIADLEAAERPEEVRGHIRQVMESGYGSFETKHRKKGGGVFDVEISTCYFQALDEFQLFVRDITKRKQAEENLQAERRRFYDVLEGLPAMVCLLTSDHHVAFANRAFRDRFGEANDRPCFEYRYGRSGPCEFCESYLVLATGQPHHWELAAPDGRVMDIYDFPFTDVDGTPMILEMNLDITDLKRAEAQVRHLNEVLEQRVRERTADLRAANQELEAFTYSVSHDLRAPLRHIDGFSQLLVEEYGPQLPQDVQSYLARIQRGVQQMGRLVDDLLNLARLGRQEINLQMTGLGSLVGQVINELKTEFADRAIAWKIKTLPFVECDPALLKQVFANLLSNAVKYTRPREQAVIEVGSMSGNGQPVIFVRDNGVGFSMKYAGKLFGVFQRLHRAEDFEGTGVGLATVQRIVHKHGGRVWAEGELDKGAAFYFTLGASRRPDLKDSWKKGEAEDVAAPSSGNPVG